MHNGETPEKLVRIRLKVVPRDVGIGEWLRTRQVPRFPFCAAGGLREVDVLLGTEWLHDVAQRVQVVVRSYLIWIRWDFFFHPNLDLDSLYDIDL